MRALALLLLLSGNARAEPAPVLPVPGWAKLSPALRVIAHAAAGSRDIAIAETVALGVPLDEAESTITVLVTAHRPILDPWRLMALGGRVDAISRDYVRVVVPLERLERLGEHPDVATVIAPDDYVPDVTSEAVVLTGARLLHSSGFTGAGIKVAVMDFGFEGLAAAKAAGELPANTIARDFTGAGMESGGKHGVGVAEHVMDMAPGAKLYVLKVGDQLDFQNACDYMRANGIRVANHSGGWINASYYDGSGIYARMVDASVGDGTFWVVSAGNEARKHWRGGWADMDADGWLEFALGDEGLDLGGVSSPICVFLNWNQYGDSQTDLDLYLKNAAGVTVSSSRAAQGGTARPAEKACATYSSAQAPYKVWVKRVSGPTAGLDVSIFSANHTVVGNVAASSIRDPAAARLAFAVGAVNQSQYLATSPAPESFSSRGPTTDGRLKPEIAGPDGTTSLTYGTKGAYGTSFSAPTTAGAAVLLLSHDPTLSPAQLGAALQSSARDVGAPGADTTFGAGLLRLGVAPVPVPSPTPSPSPSPTPAPVPVTTPAILAADAFASTSKSGGTGWAGAWTLSGYAGITSLGGAYSAPLHLRLLATGTARRTVTPGAASALRLTFRSRLRSLEGADSALVKVSIDGGAWKTVRTFTSADADGVYRGHDIDLGAGGSLAIWFEARMSGRDDIWYVDDVQVTGTR